MVKPFEFASFKTVNTALTDEAVAAQRQWLTHGTVPLHYLRDEVRGAFTNFEDPTVIVLQALQPNARRVPRQNEPPATAPMASHVLGGAVEYVKALAVLPLDRDADQRIEKLLAEQPKRGSRKRLSRK